MQIIINVVFVIACVGFIWLVLKELKESQKLKETIEGKVGHLHLNVELVSEGGKPRRSHSHPVLSVEVAQEVLNHYHLFRIARAGVWDEDKQVAVMNPNGVLEVL